MANTITIHVPDSTVTIYKPTYGYSSEIHMPITITETHPFGYAYFDADPTGASDYRVLNTASWQLPTSQKVLLNQFFRDADKGRGTDCTMSLEADSGFFPFGPDLGDGGDFVVRLIAQDQGGILNDPYQHWQDDLQIVLVSTEEGYTSPARLDQGNLVIGDCTGLMWPQEGFKPVSNYNISSVLTRLGDPSSMDGREDSDFWESSWSQRCNAGNACQLINFLLTERTETISITGAENYYIYGADQTGAGVYPSKFLGSERSKNEIVLKVTHEAFNRFTMPLVFFWLEE